MIKTIIIDDAAQIRKLLRLMLTDLAKDVIIVGEAENVEQAKTLIHSEKPDLIFLDIEMPGKNGLQLVEEFSQQNIEFHVIFVTAFNQYAAKAFRLSAIDYLLKPIKEKELLEALDRTRQQIQLKKSSEKLKILAANLRIQHKDKISIPLKHGYDYLSVNDIEYIEAEGAYSFIHLLNGERKLVSKHLKYFENILCQFDMFTKVHRSFIVNMSHIRTFRKEDRGILVMVSEKKINISRSYRENFLERFNQHQVTR